MTVNPKLKCPLLSKVEMSFLSWRIEVRVFDLTFISMAVGKHQCVRPKAPSRGAVGTPS